MGGRMTNFERIQNMSVEEMAEILNVKIGDKVIVTSPWNRDKISIVEKITPTGLIKVDGYLYTQGDAIDTKYIQNLIEENKQLKIDLEIANNKIENLIETIYNNL